MARTVYGPLQNEAFTTREAPTPVPQVCQRCDSLGINPPSMALLVAPIQKGVICLAARKATDACPATRGRDPGRRHMEACRRMGLDDGRVLPRPPLPRMRG